LISSTLSLKPSATITRQHKRVLDDERRRGDSNSSLSSNNNHNNHLTTSTTTSINNDVGEMDQKLHELSRVVSIGGF